MIVVPLAVSVSLERVDLLVALRPDRLRDEPVDAHDEDVLVVRSVEDADLALARRALWIRHRKSWPSSSGGRDLERGPGQPCGLNASITLLIVPSLPAASMPCRTIRTDGFDSAQKPVLQVGQPVELAAEAGPAASLSQPKVALGSIERGRSAMPGWTRRASRRLVGWASAVLVGAVRQEPVV